MAITAISINEAFAQGSSYSQMSSVAKFHRDQIIIKQKAVKVAIAKATEAKALDWKIRRLKQEVATTVQQHEEYASYFEKMACSMRGQVNEAVHNAR